MINMGELFANDRIYDIPMEFVPLKESEKLNARVECGDLLFARQSLVLEGAGKCSIVMEVSPLTVFESHLIRVRLDRSQALPMFYYYYFRSSLSPVKSIVSQCAQAGIRGSDLQELQVILPPIKVQQRIAEIISRYDDLIENNQKQIKLLEEAAQRLYKEWFVDLRFPGHETAHIVDGIPEGWSKEELGNIAVLGAGGDRPKVFSKVKTVECSVPVFSNGTEDEGLYGFTNLAEIYDPCVTISARGSVGYTCLRKVAFVPIVRLISVIPKQIEVEYLFYFLKNMVFESNGAAQQQITVPMIKNKQVVLPAKTVINLFPKQIKLLAYYAVTYTCDSCEKDTGFAHIVTVKPPVPLMKHSLASPSTVAYIMTQKYVDGLPLARQEKMWAREGISLSRATMANWVIQCAQTWLKPLYRHMKQELLTHSVIHADETVVQVLKEDGKPATSQSRMWLYASAALLKHQVRLFEYQPDRSGKRPEAFLKGFTGALVTDGYQ